MYPWHSTEDNLPWIANSRTCTSSDGSKSGENSPCTLPNVRGREIIIKAVYDIKRELALRRVGEDRALVTSSEKVMTLIKSVAVKYYTLNSIEEYHVYLLCRCLWFLIIPSYKIIPWCNEDSTDIVSLQRCHKVIQQMTWIYKSATKSN